MVCFIDNFIQYRRISSNRKILADLVYAIELNLYAKTNAAIVRNSLTRHLYRRWHRLQ